MTSEHHLLNLAKRVRGVVGILKPGHLPALASNLFRRTAQAAALRFHDSHLPSYAAQGHQPTEPLASYLGSSNIEMLDPFRGSILASADAAKRHVFDLLGSGNVEVRYGTECLGTNGYHYSRSRTVVADADGRWIQAIVSPQNRREARSVWRLVQGPYQAINWGLDFKSGFEWSAHTWYGDVDLAPAPGVDPKVPWELARMHHLLHFALAHRLDPNCSGESPHRDIYAQEFRNQVLDFISTNPPRFGINWASPMEVAIRLSNWCVAFDLFQAAKHKFDPQFEAIFSKSILEHGRHVAAHLEWGPTRRTNHYLSNIVGLIFCASYLPESKETSVWLNFAARELAGEILQQFNPDGSNFEASTAYHRLSAEMATWAAVLIHALRPAKRAVVLSPSRRAQMLRPGRVAPHLTEEEGVPQAALPLLPRECVRRLERAAEFSLSATRPDGHVVQFGDDDSGRFLPLVPHRGGAVDSPGIDDSRDHSHLIASIAAITGREDLEQSVPNRPEAQILRSTLNRPPRPRGLVLTPDHNRYAPTAFPDFGLFVLRNESNYLAIRCGTVGQNGVGGHAHNDQLSFEYCAGTWPICIDTGSFVYLPMPEMRNYFRSTRMHNTLEQSGLEQGAWASGTAGLFSLSPQGRTRVVSFSGSTFVGEIVGAKVHHRRSLTLLPDGIEGDDTCVRTDIKRIRFHFAPLVRAISVDSHAGIVMGYAGGTICLTSADGRWSTERDSVSPGYGRRVTSTTAILEADSPRVAWRLRTLPAPRDAAVLSPAFQQG